MLPRGAFLRQVDKSYINMRSTIGYHSNIGDK